MKKELPESKRSNNVWIVLLKDLGDYALYLNKTNNCFAGFEVHKIRIRPAGGFDVTQKDGSVRHVSVPERRVIAGNEEFGRYAWHFPNIGVVYKNYPQFKKYNQEIETKLKEATKTCSKRVSCDTIIKTIVTNSKPFTSHVPSNVITQNGNRTVRCNIAANNGFFDFTRKV